MLAGGQARMEQARPWLVLGLVAGIAVVAATSAVAEQARADARGLASELAVVLVSAGAQTLVLAVLWLALSLAMPRPPAVPWTALVPGACCSRPGSRGTQWPSASTSPRGRPGPRPSTGRWGVALVLLVSLFLFARLAVAAAELNATLEERRRPPGPAA